MFQIKKTIMIFIWKVILAIAHHIYSTVIRSVLMHKAAVWHMNPDMNKLRMTHQNYKNKLVKKLVKMQNKYLWVVINAYKIMSTTVLKIKTHIFLLDLYLNTRLVSFHQWHKKSDMKKMIKKTCKKI